MRIEDSERMTQQAVAQRFGRAVESRPDAVRWLVQRLGDAG
jgi:hypothetical protein